MRTPAGYLTPVIALALLASCGGGDGDRERTTVRTDCPPPEDSALARAVSHYIAAAQPRPMRFLASFGSDSALPEAGRAVLQDKGPTWLFPDDTSRQAPVRERLILAGDFPTLLLYHHGTRLISEDSAEVRLSGRYVVGTHEGTVAPKQTVALTCVDGQWKAPSDTASTRAAAET